MARNILYASQWIDDHRIIAHVPEHSSHWHKPYATHVELRDGTLLDGNLNLDRMSALLDGARRYRALTK